MRLSKKRLHNYNKLLNIEHLQQLILDLTIAYIREQMEQVLLSLDA